MFNFLSSYFPSSYYGLGNVTPLLASNSSPKLFSYFPLRVFHAIVFHLSLSMLSTWSSDLFIDVFIVYITMIIHHP
jgi:hypothetical protein